MHQKLDPTILLSTQLLSILYFLCSAAAVWTFCTEGDKELTLP